MADARDIAALQAALQLDFRQPALLEQALTHRSLLAEVDGVQANERLEFLGDAVLGLLVAEVLFLRHPDWSEGDLSKAKAAVVDETALAAVARRWELGAYMRLARGEAASGGRERAALLADAVEALLGAYYLDRGLDACRAFVLRELAESLDTVTRHTFHRDFKTQLQEFYQGRHQATPTYTVVEESGPPHNPTFTVAVVFDGCELGRGQGKSKKSAEQHAARAALDAARVDE
jgi:ribonuclease-3